MLSKYSLNEGMVHVIRFKEATPHYFFGSLNELIRGKHLTQCLTHTKCSVNVRENFLHLFFHSTSHFRYLVISLCLARSPEVGMQIGFNFGILANNEYPIRVSMMHLTTFLNYHFNCTKYVTEIV